MTSRARRARSRPPGCTATAAPSRAIRRTCSQVMPVPSIISGAAGDVPDMLTPFLTSQVRNARCPGLDTLRVVQEHDWIIEPFRPARLSDPPGEDEKGSSWREGGGQDHLRAWR